MGRGEYVDTSVFWDFRKRPPISHRDEPLPLAEHLQKNLAEDGLKHYSESKTPEGLLQSSWRMLEYALSTETPLDADMRRTYISYYVPQLLADVLAMSKNGNPLRVSNEAYRASPQQNSYHHALLMGAYIPIFNKRAVGLEITRQDCRDLHASMSMVIREELALGKSLQETRLSENVTSMLSTRTGQPDYTLHIASPREEASHTAKYNHDRYFIRDQEKIPVQIKLGKTASYYASPVQVLDIEGMLEFAAMKAGVSDIISAEPDSIAANVRYAANLLVGEQENEFLYPEEQAFLNIASQAIVSIQKRSSYLEEVA